MIAENIVACIHDCNDCKMELYGNCCNYTEEDLIEKVDETSSTEGKKDGCK